MGFDKSYLIISAVIFAAVTVLHSLTVFTKKASQLLGWVNVALHIPLIVFLFLGGASLRLLLLIISFSALVYTFLSYVAQRRSIKTAPSDTMGEEASDS